MISRETFDHEWGKLCAAYSTDKPMKTMKAWFDEFEECELEPFMQAMHACRYLGHFPVWEDFLANYKRFTGCRQPGENSGVWDNCKSCDGGRVYWIKLDSAYGPVYFSSPCKTCQPNAPGAVDPYDGRLLDYSTEAIPDGKEISTNRIRAFLNGVRLRNFRGNKAPMKEDNPEKEKERGETLAKDAREEKTYPYRETDDIPF